MVGGSHQQHVCFVFVQGVLPRGFCASVYCFFCWCMLYASVMTHTIHTHSTHTTNTHTSTPTHQHSHTPSLSHRCIPCTLPHCDMCNTDGTCNKCLTGYGLDPSRACTQCSDPLCFRCHGNASACETCFAFASLNPTNNTCVRCSIPNCSTCSAGGGCTKCLAGYGGDGNGGCAPCAAGCAVCGADADVCEACMPFHASGGNTTTDGVECASCAYKAVCTDTTRMVWVGCWAFFSLLMVGGLICNGY